MKTNRKITIGLIALASLTSAALIGIAAGSLAWYAYSRTGIVSYRGTSIANTALLNVGIVDDPIIVGGHTSYRISNDTVEHYGLARESHDGHSIVFNHSTNGFDYHVIAEFLSNAGYAVEKLSPITTQERSLSSTEDLSLFKSPEYGHTNINTAANETDFVRLPLAFRVGNASNEGVIDTDVWLTGAAVQADYENIHEAVRVFIDNGNRRFLMKPNSTATTAGATNVGGLLDLDGDGTYDYNSNSAEHREYYYGQYTGTLAYAESEYGGSQADAPMVNVNGVEDTSEPSTFYAMHNISSRIINNLDAITPKVAEYETFGTVNPSLDPDTGDYIVGATGIPITRTSGVTGVGYATFTIFIEGWDHSVVDKAAGYDFNLDLKFEINKID